MVNVKIILSKKKHITEKIKQEILDKIRGIPAEVSDIVKEYFTYQIECEAEYGNNTIVLMQVGNFYETYEIENPSYGRCSELENILNIKKTSKNGNKPHSYNNPYMSGFAVQYADKNIVRIVNNNYSVVLVDQDGTKTTKRTSRGKLIECENRKITRVCSPGTYLDDNTNMNNTNYLMSIYFEFLKDGQQKIAHLAAVDLTTGHCFTHDVFDHKTRSGECLKEVRRFINSISPSEIIINDKTKDYLDKTDLDSLGISNIMHHYRPIESEWEKLKFQEKFLTKVFGEQEIQSTIEAIGLAKYPDLIVSLIFLLQFAYQHDPNIVTRIRLPENQLNNQLLVLNDDSILQLNIVDDVRGETFLGYGGARFVKQGRKKITSLVSLLDHALSLIHI